MNKQHTSDTLGRTDEFRLSDASKPVNGSSSRPPYKVVSLFTGAGGIDIGFESLGVFETAVALDCSDYCVDTLILNQAKGHAIRSNSLTPWLEPIPGASESVTLLHGAKIQKMDLSEASSDDIRALYGGPIDVVYGGPPCQPFSIRNRRTDKGLHDERGRGNLVFSFIKLVGELNPAVFLFENVRGLEDPEYGGLLDRLVHFAEKELKYSVNVCRIVATHYGAPQTRRRIIIVGVRTGLKFDPPEETHGVTGLFDSFDRRPEVTVGQALEGLPRPGEANFPPNHRAPMHTQEMVERFKTVAPGKQDPIRKKIRLDAEKSCPAIFSGSDTGGGLADIHPWEHRALTPRECARLQCFPDFWELGSNRTGENYKMVANAVPPTVAAAFARRIATTLQSGRGSGRRQPETLTQ